MSQTIIKINCPTDEDEALVREIMEDNFTEWVEEIVFTNEEINFILTLLNINGDGIQYAYPGWKSVWNKIKMLTP